MIDPSSDFEFNNIPVVDLISADDERDHENQIFDEYDDESVDDTIDQQTASTNS